MNRIEFDLKLMMGNFTTKFPTTLNLYLFGSRLRRTKSERSDIDILVKFEDHIKPSSIREYSDELSKALDMFILNNGRAISCVNDSFLQADSDNDLVLRIGAIEFWNKEIGFLDDANIDWMQTVRADVQFTKTVLNPWYEVKKPEQIVINSALVINTREYIESIVYQVNKSYISGCYDACAVLSRRLIETLIIEVYEEKGISDDIKHPDGNYKMLKDLISIIKTSTFNLDRNTKKALDEIKRIGDLSAHNRRFKARTMDIDSLRPHLRIAIEILVSLANIQRST